MTQQPDLDLTQRQLILAIVAIGAGQTLLDYVVDTGDFGRKFNIGTALKHAQSLHDRFDDEEWKIIDNVCMKLSIKPDAGREKGTVAKQIITRLLRAA